MTSKYVHGYSERENQRLNDQATTLTDLLHSDSIFPPGSHVLEAGCGVGAQIITLAAKNPDVKFTSMDISEKSVAEARARVQAAGLSNVEFMQGDIFNMSFPDAKFDHLFVCFVLEHLKNPVQALSVLSRVVKPGGTIQLIEGDHGSVYFYPESDYARRAIQCQIELQAKSGGNALIGRELYPLLMKAGYKNIHVSPRMVYVDSSKPELVDGFTRKTFTAMIEGVRDLALQDELIEAPVFDRGIKDLYRTSEIDGVFCYTFFKAFAEK